MMFKFCNKCLDMRQFKHDPADAFNKDPRRCDVCGISE